MTQVEFINSFPAKALTILENGNVTASLTSPEAAKAYKAMLSKAAPPSPSGIIVIISKGTPDPIKVPL
jgi:hypothetical protein